MPSRRVRRGARKPRVLSHNLKTVSRDNWIAASLRCPLCGQLTMPVDRAVQFAVYAKTVDEREEFLVGSQRKFGTSGTEFAVFVSCVPRRWSTGSCFAGQDGAPIHANANRANPVTNAPRLNVSGK
jgi:hypothetical protein